MKKTEIHIGTIYSDGKGREREVLAMGPEYVLYEGQTCKENLRYRIIKDGSKKNASKGTERNMTVAAFAAWSKTPIN